MNMKTSFQAEDINQLPATLENIGDLCKGRDLAIELWLQRYDQFHAMGDLCASASLAGIIGIRGDSGGRYDSDGVSPAFVDAPDRESEHFVTDGADREARGKRVRFNGRDWFARIITHEVDRRCWSTMLDRLGFDRFLDRQAREEFAASLKAAPPEFTVDNCMATFGHYWANRGDIWLRGLANIFIGLDRRFRSHDAFAIGNRIVLEYCFSDWGNWQNYNRRDTIRDVERIFRELEGLAPGGYDEGMARQLEVLNNRRPTAGTIEGEYFRARSFKNGNVHLWFTRKDLLKKINQHLLDYFKPVEGDAADDGAPSYDSGPAYHQTPARNFGEFFSSAEVAQRVIDEAGIRDGMTVLEPSAGGGVLATTARMQGAQVDCVEVQTHWAEALRNGGFKTICGDFLRIDPARHGMQYDRIVMNPPFDRGRDCDHVRHAYKFLKPGGKLVAIMSARAEFATDGRHKALHDLIDQLNGARWSCNARWRDLPERSFAHAGTNVNTVMLVLEKPR